MCTFTLNTEKSELNDKKFIYIYVHVATVYTCRHKNISVYQQIMMYMYI